jgi:putative ATPase
MQMFQAKIPLAERMRPSRLEDLIGQEHLVGPNGIIRKAIQSGNVPSMILWGPPGVGKTTIANIIANEVKRPFQMLECGECRGKRCARSNRSGQTHQSRNFIY